MTGRWIALEGGEGSGKSTQAARLATSLAAVLTREPGGTDVGIGLRSLLLDPTVGVVDPRAEALMMAADRAQHVGVLVGPALSAGQHVVSDRSAWSSLAYQGYGRGLDVAVLRATSDWATGGQWPDLAILVDVPLEAALQRVSGRGAALDRFEASGSDFHARVAAGFASLAAASPEQWAVVSGAGSVEEVAARIRKVVGVRLGI